MTDQDSQTPKEGTYLMVLVIVNDQDRSRACYGDVLGAEVVLGRDPCILHFHNRSIVVSVGGGPTDDGPGVSMAAIEPKVTGDLTGRPC